MPACKPSCPPPLGEPLIELLDSLPSETYSAKLERLLAKYNKYKQIEEERKTIGHLPLTDLQQIEAGIQRVLGF